MIYDTKANLRRYEGLDGAFDRAIAYLRDTDFSAMPVGRYSVSGDDVFALVQTPMTRDRAEALWESHARYVDIQYLLEGSERIGFRDVSALDLRDPYDGQKDIAFYRDDGSGFFVDLDADSFVVCFPSEAHMPLVHSGKAGQIKKVVLKVRVF